MHTSTGPSASADTAPVWRAQESGIGLIEIVVSMFLIALLAMAFLPLLIQSLKATTTNTSVASATQLVSQQLERVRTVGATCSAITSFASTDPAPVTDDRGVVLSIDRQLVGACPTTFPGTIGFRVVVSADGESLSDAATRILVTGP
jgi:type II secretory pathway pseudopilin PulG